MCWSRTARVAAVACGLGLAAPALGQSAGGQAAGSTEAERFWVLGINGQLDEESSSSLLATLDFAPSESTWLSAAVGESRSPERSADITANTLELGVEHDFGPLGIGFRAQRWGDSGDLESSDLYLSLFFGNARYRVSYEYERRDIDLHISLTGPLGRDIRRVVGIDGRGSTLRFRAAAGQRWQVFGSRTEYSYSRNLSLLPRVDVLNLLSASALTLANSFLDDYWALGIEREIGRSMLSVAVSRDRSAVDGTRFESVAAAYLFPVGRRMDLELSLGRGDSELGRDGYVGGLTLLVYGGG